MPRYTEKKKAAVDAMMKDEVYSAAVQLLSSEGASALTMDRIAKEVGVSRGTIYNYFDDADAVLAFVEDRTFTPLLDEIARIGSSDLQPPVKLEQIFRATIAAIFETRALVMAVFPTHESSGPRHENKLKMHEQLGRIIQKLVREGIDQGVFRPVSPALVAEIFRGTVTGLVETMTYSGDFRQPDEVVPGLMDFFMRGLSSTA